MTLHLHAPSADRAEINRGDCPTCAKATRFVEIHVPWYGWTSSCLRCGDSWQDGERLERPFARGWRPRAIEEARARYRRARERLRATSEAAA